MSKRLPTCGLVIAASLAVCGSAGAATELVRNGSFEQPDLGPVTYEQVDSIPDWTGTAGIEIQTDGVLGLGNDTPFGDQYVELNVEAASTYSQTVSTVAGREYTLSFYLAARPGAGDTSVSVAFGGQESQVFTVEETPQISFERFTMSVTATGDESVLAFVPTESAVNGQGDLLDNVSLMAVDAGGGNGGPNPIPLPPGVWTGLGTLFALAAPRALRRWRASAAS